MIITFRSEAYETITMFGNVAQRLLKIMGYDKTYGTIQPEEIAKALARLKEATSVAAPEKHLSTSNAADDSEREENISLAHRAFTLVEMLEASEKEKCEVTWKVG